jgi:putative transposase
MVDWASTGEVNVTARKRYTPEEIIQHLRTIELETGKRLAVLDACRKLGITEQTYYRWKKEYGRLRVDQAKRLKTMEQEKSKSTESMECIESSQVLVTEEKTGKPSQNRAIDFTGLFELLRRGPWVRVPVGSLLTINNFRELLFWYYPE